MARAGFAGASRGDHFPMSKTMFAQKDAIPGHARQQLLIGAAARQGSSLATADAVAQRNLLLAIVTRIAVHRDRVEVMIDRGGVIQLLGGNADASAHIAAPYDPNSVLNLPMDQLSRIRKRKRPAHTSMASISTASA